MTTTDSHPIRNGVIATVIGGIALAVLSKIWPPAKVAMLWVGAKIGRVVDYLKDDQSIPVWLLILLSLLSISLLFLLTVIFIRNNLQKNQPAYMQYTQDSFYGAIWRWSWSNGGIKGLWAYCPACDCELVRGNTDNDFFLDPRTVLICEHCSQTVSTIRGGDHNYALSAIERLIRRKVRTSEQNAGAS